MVVSEGNAASIDRALESAGTMDVRESPSLSVTVAAFDFDRTLTNRDCVIPFLRMTATSSRLFSSVVDLPSIGYAALKRDRDAVKQIVTSRFLSGTAKQDLERIAEEFSRQVLEKWMRDDMVTRLRWHVDQGHRVVIVSASYGLYLRPIGEALGADSVIATELEFGHDGIATGQLIGGNCRGPEKARRLRSWLQERDIHGATVHAYGDSAGDREMLQMAHTRHWVRRASMT